MRTQNADKQAVRQAVGLSVDELDFADAPFDDSNLDAAVANGLPRQIGLGKEVAARAVERANFRRYIVQSFEVELLADEFLHLRLQRLFGIERVARESEALHRHLQLRRSRERGRRLRRLRQDGLVRRRQAYWLALLLEQLAGIGPRRRLREGTSARKREDSNGRQARKLRSASTKLRIHFVTGFLLCAAHTTSACEKRFLDSLRRRQKCEGKRRHQSLEYGVRRPSRSQPPDRPKRFLIQIFTAFL